jgi:Polyglycine hydrolase-like, structural repeat
MEVEDMFSCLYQRIAFSAVLRRCFVGVYVVSLVALGANEVRSETTIVASAEGSQSPVQASHPETVPNGDFTIEGTTGVVGDGIDERTTWTFDFSSDADLALFDPARGLSSAMLTLTLTPRNLDVETDFVAIEGLPTISSSEIQGLSVGTAATVTLDLLDFPGYGQSEILSVFTDDNVIPMIYADDAIVSGASLALTQSDAASSGLRYEAVWHSGEQPSLHTAPLTLEAFLATGQQLAENNESPLRLIDIETAILDGRRVYAGLWTPGTGTNLFEGPMGPISMREAIRRNGAQNRHLIDFEVFPTRAGGRRYLGVWADGAVDQVLTGPMEQAAFFARGEQETQAGKRLVDVELFRSQGTLLYNGLFQTGSGSNFLTAPLTRDDFTEERDRLVAEGLELVDFERIATPDGDRFVGVWASGDGESRISRPREFAPYFIFAQSQFNDGKHTEDFELRPIVMQAGGDEPDPPDLNPADPSSVLPNRWRGGSPSPSIRATGAA